MKTASRWGLLPLTTLAACDSASDLNPFSEQRNSYPAKLVNNFVTFCKGAGGSSGLCECVIGEAQKNIPLNEYNEMEVLLRVDPGTAAKSEAFKKLAASRLACSK